LENSKFGETGTRDMIDTGITAKQLSKYIDDKMPLLILDIRSKEKFMQGYLEL